VKKKLKNREEENERTVLSRSIRTGQGASTREESGRRYTKGKPRATEREAGPGGATLQDHKLKIPSASPSKGSGEEQRRGEEFGGTSTHRKEGKGEPVFCQNWPASAWEGHDQESETRSTSSKGLSRG